MESMNIAQKLEELHPSPSLHLDTGIHETVSAALSKAAGPLLPVFMPIVGRSIVVDSDKEWFEADRSKRFGTSMADWEATKGGQQAWDAARPGLIELKKVLKENKKDEGPFILGSTPTYGDLVILSFIMFFKATGLYGKWVEEYDGAEMDVLWEAGGKWCERKV